MSTPGDQGIQAARADARSGDSKAEALARIRRAMEHVEEAQRELGRAATELSSLLYCAPIGNQTMRLYDRVHAHWYKLQAKLKDKRVDLDGMSQLSWGKEGGR